MVKAYVLINVARFDDVEKVVEQLREHAEIKSVEAITGPYDVMALVESESTDALGQFVVNQIRRITEVSATLTNVVLPS